MAKALDTRYFGKVIEWLQGAENRRFAIAVGWLLAVAVAASQWYAYDAVRGHAERFSYYLLTLAYLSGVLSPLILWLVRRWPFGVQTWKRALLLHAFASLLLTGAGVCVEAAIGWYSHAASWSFRDALRHYFTQHTQISLVTYWVLIAGVQIYRAYDRSRLRELRASQLEAQLAAAHLRSLRAQLQPHFLFNTLQAATTLIYEDPEGAEEVLLSLSELLRISLKTLEQLELPFSSEIDFVKHYAAIQQRRFGDRLRFDFQIEKQAYSCALPSLLLQPLVENAVHHGIGSRKQSDVISIRGFLEGDQLTIEIKNRTGALDETLENLVLRGVGLSNTIARLEYLYGPHHSFAVRNLSPMGVAVSLSIPAKPFPRCVPDLEAQAVS